MKEKTIEILNALDSSDTIKKMRKLKLKLKENKEYNPLINNFIKNKSSYESKDILSEEIINLRKKLFNISEFKEYLNLQNELRLLSININNIIMSVLN